MSPLVDSSLPLPKNLWVAYEKIEGPALTLVCYDWVEEEYQFIIEAYVAQEWGLS